MNTTHRASLLALAIALSPVAASAQFVVAGQSGTATTTTETHSIAAGQLTSATAQANTDQQISDTRLYIVELSDAKAQTVIANDSLFILSHAMVQVVPGMSSNPTAPPSSNTTTASATVQLDFDLASATAVKLSIDNTTVYGPYSTPLMSTSLVHWLDGGLSETIALPELHAMTYDPNTYPTVHLVGESLMSLAAGRYSMISSVLPDTPPGYSAPNMGGTNRFTITAVPEISQWGMVSVGLVVVAFAARRRRQARSR